MVKLVCWFFVIVVLKDSGVRLQPASCDVSRRGAAREGVLGSVHAFPWLGVLRVHLHHETSLKIALTGIVLVKERYAIGNADDIVRIPKRVLQEDSRAMFIPAERAPWFCRPVDYMTHPEYELDTLSSLAIIELQPPPDTRFPMKPVCWPPYSYNTSNNLYAVGYTDDNQALEKVIHRIQYVDQELCKEFYNRAGLAEGSSAPVHYDCGFAYNNKDNCVWDNGMALISNSSGHWVLVGFGLQGPGCAAPARFLSLSHYYTWIESATNVQEIDEQPIYRKSAFNEGFKKPNNTVEYIPAHELLSSSGSVMGARKQHAILKHEFGSSYPYSAQNEDPFRVNRISETEIHINLPRHRPYRLGSYGNCSAKNIHLIYKDYINVTAKPTSKLSPGKIGSVQYKLSLFDSMFENYTCVTIKLHVRRARTAFLYYDTVIDDGTIFPETPEELVRVYPFYTLTNLVKKGEKDHLYPAPISSTGRNYTVYNINVYLKIVFQGECRMEIRFFGPIGKLHEVKKTVVETTETPVDIITDDPYFELRKNIPLFVEPALVKSDFTFEKSVYNNAPLRKIGRGLFLLLVTIIVL